MVKPKVYLTRQIPQKAINMIKEYYEIVGIWEEYYPPPYEVLIEKVKDIDALVSLLTDKIDKNLIDNAPKLRIIAQYAVGYDNIDVEYATKKGIYVTNTPGVLTEAVADLTWALILGVARRIVEADEYVKKGEWWKTKTGWHPMMMLGIEIHGKTLGILGMGRIGRAVARRAKGFNMRVIYYSRRRLPEELEKELNAEYVDFETLLKESDILSIHVPLTKETYHMIGEKQLKMMKRNAILINTARGAVIDTAALIKALEKKWIAGAGLDVFEQEPLPPDNPLTKFKNVVMAPHMGSATHKTRTRMGELVAENLIAFIKGEIPPTLVNKEVVDIRKPGF
ncbi:MAG: D-glycerate dehydrogenase [Thermoproteales archaeon]|nr:D-glycerate dehydrogenase [Thermoproteales archaeon]